MKDILTLLIYTVVTVGAIFILIAMSRMELPSSVDVGSAIFLVVVLPVILAVKAGKKEQEAKRLANKAKQG